VPNFVAIPGTSDDARAVRTRGQLASALIALMHEKSFDEISVQEICERAQVGRSTFYAHFQDRDELFIRHTVVFARMLGEQLTWSDTLTSYCFPLRHLLEHVKAMRLLFDSLGRARKLEFIMKVWRNNLAEVFEQRIAAVRGVESVARTLPAALLAQQLSGTLMTLMVWWMEHHYPLSEQDMEQKFQHLIAGIGR
jgi:AcrR family transcriptional regulator